MRAPALSCIELAVIPVHDGVERRHVPAKKAQASHAIYKKQPGGAPAIRGDTHVPIMQA
jgi:hypothetical protein